MSDDPKAKDLLRQRELSVRRRLGESTLERIGRRRSEGPGSARRKRLFDRLGVANPYDPDAKERPISIGSVGLKLSERRRPAPHAKVKDPNEKKKNPHVPQKRPSPRPASPAPTSAPPAPRPAAKSAAKKKKGGVGEIPDNLPPAIRRRLEAQKAQNLASEFKRELKPRQAAPEPPPEERSEPNRLPDHLRPGGSSKQKRRGRLRMSRTRSTGAPVVRELPPPVEAVEETPVVEPPPPERVVERRPPPGGDVGLDDLFGFANEGRMKLGRRKKSGPTETEADPDGED